MGPSAKTQDGVNIYLDSYYVHDTYSGVLEGAPAADEMVKAARHQLERMWGTGRPILVEQPQVQVIHAKTPNGPTFERLPQRCMMAWLNSYTAPEGSDGDGSHLFVIWFDDDDARYPLTQALKVVNDNGGWWKNAAAWWM